MTIEIKLVFNCFAELEICRKSYGPLRHEYIYMSRALTIPAERLSGFS